MRLGEKVPRIVEDLITEASIMCLPNLFSATLQPLGDHVLRNFEMELEAIAHMADSHGLVGIILRIDQTHCPLRKMVGISMPLKDHEFIGEGF